MKIIEPDCYLEHINGVYHLYLLKNKKELKENNEDKFKIGGYYGNTERCIENKK